MYTSQEEQPGIQSLKKWQNKPTETHTRMDVGIDVQESKMGAEKDQVLESMWKLEGEKQGVVVGWGEEQEVWCDAAWVV